MHHITSLLRRPVDSCGLPSMSPAANPTRARLARAALAVLCSTFLAWRGSCALISYGEELPMRSGLLAEAVTASEEERIDTCLARVEEEAGLQAGYLSDLFRALRSLPPGARILYAQPSTEPRLMLFVRLKFLLYPRRLERVRPSGQATRMAGLYFLAFDSTPLPGSEALERVATGPDWTIWR